MEPNKKVDNRNIGRISAEDKLKRSMKSLSHTSGGMGGGGFNIDLNSSQPKARDNQRKKVGGVVLDLDTIQSSTDQKLHVSNKRKNVVILVLCLLLAVSLVYLAVSIINFNNSKRNPNCKYNIIGNADAQWIVQDSNQTELIVIPGLGTNKIYKIKSELKINTTASCTLTLEVNAYIDNAPITFAGLEGMHESLLPIKNQPTKYEYNGTITGGATLLLFTGIDFTDAPNNLSSDNVVIDIIAYINLV